MGKRKNTKKASGSRITRKRTKTTGNPRAGKRPRTEEPENDNPHSERSSQPPGPDEETPEIREDMSREELYEVTRDLEAQVNELRRSQLESGRTALADITNEGSDSEEEEDEVPEPDPNYILCKGKHFGYAHLVFLPGEDDCFTTNETNDYNDLDRYKTRESRIQGAIRDLKVFIPADYHAAAEWSGWVRDDVRRSFSALSHSHQLQFRRGLHDQQSVFANRLRAHASWFGVDDKDWITSAGREKLADKLGRKPKPGSPGEFFYDTFDVPLLHKDYDGSRDLDKIFLSDEIFVVHAGLTKGISGANEIRTGKPAPRNVTTVHKLWGLKKTTPGMVAAAAIFVRHLTSSRCYLTPVRLRWAHSRDETFAPVGDVTGIEWEEDFNAYLAFFKKGLDEKTECVLNIFRVWDGKFYADSDASEARNTDPSATQTSRNDAMEELE
uniref:Uncharacterized protein n=1 Tax=Mycena chlorophos TaxID=658473 RepID=A0ABQ0LCC3_MYCCL|nr:predicted protein [Mycena chlorophos]